MNDEERKEFNQLYEKYGMLQNSAIAKNEKIKEVLAYIEKLHLGIEKEYNKNEDDFLQLVVMELFEIEKKLGYDRFKK